MPIGWDVAAGPLVNTGGEWSMALQAYINTNNNICLCPMATIFRSSLGANMWTDNNTQNLAWGIMGTNGYTAPSGENWGVPGIYGSYGINGWMYNPSPLGTSAADAGNPAYWRKLSAAFPGHNVPLFGDCNYDGSSPTNTDVPPTVANQQTAYDMSNWCITRHDGRSPVTLSFVDSSVIPVGLKQLWRLKWCTTFNVSYQDSLNGGHGAWPPWMNAFN
jgi:hypothetical protein